MQQTIARYAEEIRRIHGAPITIQVGINSGEIVVSSINNDLYMDYTVVGQKTAHLASRMEQMAMPGSVLAAADTIRLVEGYVEAKSLGEMTIKGLRSRLKSSRSPKGALSGQDCRLPLRAG